MWPVPRCCNQGTKESQFCTVGYEERTGGREAEESSLLEAVTRERLMKTQQAGGWLRECCVDL
jgi:hypothetical protein